MRSYLGAYGIARAFALRAPLWTAFTVLIVTAVAGCGSGEVSGAGPGRPVGTERPTAAGPGAPGRPDNGSTVTPSGAATNGGTSGSIPPSGRPGATGQPGATDRPGGADRPGGGQPDGEQPGVGRSGSATAAPSWLGRRVLPIGPDGFGVADSTPRELRNRRLVTVDRLAPPPDGKFRSRISVVPDEVRKRSTWSSACPVRLNQLRYVTVVFRGFDGRAHTGELLVNRSVARDVVKVFRTLFEEDWPIEEMRVVSAAELTAPPTGDGTNTSAFACRAVRGTATTWSQHAYGLAIDLNPFHNPYVRGRTVLPELAKSYTDRRSGKPGMNIPDSAPVRAFAAIGWGWGGDYTTKKDWMHFSSTGK